MTQAAPPHAAPPSAATLPAPGSALAAPHDCDVCIIGDDAAGLLMACDLAARGLEVILFPSPNGAATPLLDATLSPGFALPLSQLGAQVGEGTAAELFRLTVEAAERGLLLAQEGGVAIGPKGRLAVARPHALPGLLREHEALERIAPGASVLVQSEDVEALLATPVFAGALGLVPAHRLDGEAFRATLAVAVGQGEITIMPRPERLETDLHGLRKYVTAPSGKVRAFQVVFSGGLEVCSATTELAPSLTPTPWVSARFQVAGAQVAYEGVAEEVGGTGLRWHWDGEHLSLAAETASAVRGHAAVAKVARRHALPLLAGARTTANESARTVLHAATLHHMPIIHEAEKGVWYCITSAEDLAHGLLGADLICKAIAEHDDRIRLLEPFGLAPKGTRVPARWRRELAYWRRRFDAAFAAQGPVPTDSASPATPSEGVLSRGCRAVRAATHLLLPPAAGPRGDR